MAAQDEAEEEVKVEGSGDDDPEVEELLGRLREAGEPHVKEHEGAAAVAEMRKKIDTARVSAEDSEARELTEDDHEHPRAVLEGIKSMISEEFGVDEAYNLAENVELRAKHLKDDLELRDYDGPRYRDLKPQVLSFKNSTLLSRMPKGYEIKEPKSYEELKEIVASAWNEDPAARKNIRAMGSRYGFSNITFSSGYLIDMTKYLWDPSLDIPEECLSARGKEIHARRHLLKSQAGTSIQTIHRLTWPKDRKTLRRWTVWEDKEKKLKYRMMQYMPGYHQLAVGGLINVGAQGQGRLKSAIQNQVLSLHLITLADDGKLRECQITPAGDKSIYDAEAWKAKFPTIELIQDDEAFNAALVCVGSFGVVYSYDFELQDAFMMKEDKFMTTLSAYKKDFAKIREHELSGKIWRHEIYISPYRDHKRQGTQPMVLKIQRKVSDDAKPEKTMDASLWGAQHASFVDGYKTASAVVWASHWFPSLCPTIMWAALLAICHKKGLVGDGIALYELGGPSATPPQVAGMIVKQEEIFGAIEKWSDCMNTKKRPCTSPCGVTFCQASAGYIGMNSQRDVAWMEMPYPDYSAKTETETCHGETFPKLSSIGASKNWQESTERTYKHLMQEPYCGRMHLGLSQTKVFFNKEYWTDEKYFKKEHIDAYLKQYRIFNSSRIFSNAFTATTGLDELAFAPK